MAIRYSESPSRVSGTLERLKQSNGDEKPNDPVSLKGNCVSKYRQRVEQEVQLKWLGIKRVSIAIAIVANIECRD